MSAGHSCVHLAEGATAGEGVVESVRRACVNLAEGAVVGDGQGVAGEAVEDGYLIVYESID